MSVSVHRNSVRGNGVEEMPPPRDIHLTQPNGTIPAANLSISPEIIVPIKALTREEEKAMRRQRREAEKAEKIRVKMEKKEAKRLEKVAKKAIRENKRRAKKIEKENLKLEKARLKALKKNPSRSSENFSGDLDVMSNQANSELNRANENVRDVNLQEMSEQQQQNRKDTFSALNPDGASKRISSTSGNPDDKNEYFEEENDDEYDQQEDDDDDIQADFIGDFDFSENQKEDQLNEGINFECLTREDLIAKQDMEITVVSELLSIDMNSATSLLRYFKWNKDKLVMKYFEDPVRVMKDAGVVQSIVIQGSSNSQQVSHHTNQKDELIESLHNNLNNPTNTQQGEEEFGECTICYCEEMNATNSYVNRCGHRFCADCWADHIRTRISEGEASSISCPSYQCNIIVGQNMIKEIIPDELFKKYFTFLTQSFVDQNERLKWCPAPNCGNAITADMIVRGQMVTCSCGHTFCFKCQQEAHYPATCDQVRRWQKKIQDESETQNWISANTQDCPKCKSFIEKNGGCNHMTCRVCSYEFCWLCMKDWKGHNDYYSCNRFLKNQKKAATKNKSSSSSKSTGIDKKEQHKAALERYLHFYSRHLNHDRSRAFEKLREAAQRKMQMLQETEATAAEVKYIQEASDQLIELRLVLKYSYVVGFFMEEPTAARNLFEYQQEILEKTAEQLSEALENPEDKIKVMNLTRLARNKIGGFNQAAIDDEN